MAKCWVASVAGLAAYLAAKMEGEEVKLAMSAERVEWTAVAWTAAETEASWAVNVAVKMVAFSGDFLAVNVAA